MDRRIGGAFPGGPQGAPGAHSSTPPILASVRQLEERRAQRRIELLRSRRARRARLGFLCAGLLAAVLGYAIGLSSHATLDEQVEALQAGRAGPDVELISKQVNRTLLELWRMEDFESLRDAGRIR